MCFDCQFDKCNMNYGSEYDIVVIVVLTVMVTVVLTVM